MVFKKILTEATKYYHGSFQDIKTFLDPDGDPYVLIPSDMSNTDSSDSSDSSSGNQFGDANNQQQNQNQQEQKQMPDPSKIYIDMNTGKRYRWDNDLDKFYETAEEVGELISGE